MVEIIHLPALPGHTRKAAFGCSISDVMYHLGEAPPRYSVPATCEFHMSPELFDQWVIAGLVEGNDDE